MAEFELTIQISAEDTEKINKAGQRVALSQYFGQKSAEMLWVQLAPFEKNEVSWGSEMGLYASPDPVEVDTVITASSSVLPAEAGFLYPFANGVFGSPMKSPAANAISTQNDVSEALTFGLIQAVTANGKRYDPRPVIALRLEHGQVAELVPTRRIAVFLYSEVDAGIIVKVVRSAALEVNFGGDPHQTIHWDGQRFVSGPLSA